MSQASALPELVRSRVTFARRALHAVELCRAGLLASGVLAVALSLGVLGGASAGDAGLWCVALVDALLVFLTFALGSRRSEAEVARQVDRRLELGGALVTAFEAEGRPRASALAERLARQVAATTSARAMRAAIGPPTLPLLAVPFCGATLLFLVLEGARTEPSRVDLASVVERLEQGIGDLREAEAGLDQEAMGAEERHRLGELLRRAASQGRELGDAPPLEALEALDEDLVELGARLPDGEEGRRMQDQLDRARAALDAARMAMGSEPPQEGPSEPVPPGQEVGEGPQEAGSPGQGRSGLAAGDENGMMFGPEAAADTPPRIRDSAVLGLRAWPEAYEGLVRRWVEARRSSDPGR